MGFEDDSSLRCAPAALISGRALQNKLCDIAVQDSRPTLQDPSCRKPRAQDAVCCVAKCARLRALCSESIWLTANPSLRRKSRATLQGQIGHGAIEVVRSCSLSPHGPSPAIAASHLPGSPRKSECKPFPRTRRRNDTRRTIALPPLVPLAAVPYSPPDPIFLHLHASERECAQTHPGIRASPLSASSHTLDQYLTTLQHDPSPNLSPTHFLLFSPPHTLSSSYLTMGAVFSAPCRRRRRAAPVVISHPKPLSRSPSGMSYMSSPSASFVYRSRRRSKGSRPTSQVSVIFDDSTNNSSNTATSSPRHSKDSSHTLASVSDIDRELGSQEQLSEKTQGNLRKSPSANSLASSLASQRANRSTLPDVPEETAHTDTPVSVTTDVTSPAETGARAAPHSIVPSSNSSAIPTVQASHSPTYHRVGTFRKRARSTRPPTASTYTHTSIHSIIDSPPSKQSEQAQSGWRQFAAQNMASRYARPHVASHPEQRSLDSSHIYISPPSRLREASTLARKRTRERPNHLRKVRRVEGYDWIRPEDLDGFESADGFSTKSTQSLEVSPSQSHAPMTTTLCV